VLAVFLMPIHTPFCFNKKSIATQIIAQNHYPQQWGNILPFSPTCIMGLSSSKSLVIQSLYL
jgi:hypothetical protein